MIFYKDVKFEYEKKISCLCSPWAGHGYFAYDLIRNLQPKMIVELGTYNGISFFSFCQAVKDARYDTHLYAVDTWQGDKHSGFYEEDVFQVVREIKEDFYPGLNIHLLRKTFDEALDEFEDDSIDLLHIDGLHTYEAVRHDFETWFSKVKKTGIILLHDICVLRDDFGVNKFWEELREQFRTIEFYQSCGLGVLFKDNDSCPSWIEKARDLQIQYTRMAEEKQIEEMISLLKERDAQIMKRDALMAERDAQARNLQEQIAFLKQTMDETVRGIHRSTSWRLTRPVRFLGRLMDTRKGASS